MTNKKHVPFENAFQQNKGLDFKVADIEKKKMQYDADERAAEVLKSIYLKMSHNIPELNAEIMQFTFDKAIFGCLEHIEANEPILGFSLVIPKSDGSTVVVSKNKVRSYRICNYIKTKVIKRKLRFIFQRPIEEYLNTQSLVNRARVKKLIGKRIINIMTENILRQEFGELDFSQVSKIQVKPIKP